MSFSATLRRVLMAAAGVAVSIAIAAPGVTAQTTLKTFSTNYTLVNLSAARATVTVSYYHEGGSNWAASPSSTTFTVEPNGGQAIVAQYFDSGMAAGRGSAVIQSNQPLGAVVQVLARNQTPSQGAYIASQTADDVHYVPLAMRRLNGTTSQIIVQNIGTSTETVSISLVKAAASPGSSYTLPSRPIAPGASWYYDLTLEQNTAAVADGWYGSAVISATSSAARLAVVSNLFAGADQLQTFNGFAAAELSGKWFVPLFASRLTNALSTPVSVQNLSGGTAEIGAISMECTRDPSSAGSLSFTKSNTQPVANNESWFFNPVVDTSFEENWFGSCVVNTPGSSVAFIQMRQPNVTASAAAYEAIRPTTNRTVFVPLVGKVLGNGFATPITIQNLNSFAITANITYTPAPAYVAGGGSNAPISETNVSIPANGSLIRNFRLTATVPSMPSGWYGTMRVVGSGAINGFVQITTLGATSGDTLMAHGVFSLP